MRKAKTDDLDNNASEMRAEKPLTRGEWLEQYPLVPEKHYRWFWGAVVGFAVVIGGVSLASVGLQMRGLADRKTNEVALVEKTRESWDTVFKTQEIKANAYAVQQQLRAVLQTLSKRPDATTSTTSTDTIVVTTSTTTVGDDTIYNR